MKKLIALFLAVCTLLMVVSCSKAETPAEDSTAADTAAEAPATEAPATEAPATEAPAVEEPVTEAPATEPVKEEAKFGFLIEQMVEWHYATFYCPYTDGNGTVGGSASGGHYEANDDDMAAFIAEHPEWYADKDLMSKWETADAPFGDCIDKGLAANTDFVNDASTNGLMVYNTFNIDKVDASTLYELDCFYDNTCYIYINGQLYFSADGNCVTQDWNGDYQPISYNATDEEKSLVDFLVDGENYIAASIKNAWGGREFDLFITYEKNSTKDKVQLFDAGTDWHYGVYNCPYTDGEGTIDGGAAGGFFDEATDDMAKFIKDNPNFMTDSALLTSWPTANAPFADRMEEIGWTGGAHGLILAKTFNVTDLEKLKTADNIVFNSAYDNAIHVYLNGTEIYVDDGECVVQDWNGGYTDYPLDTATIAGLLKEGENLMVVTIKDAWGGRNFDGSFFANWN